MHEEECKLCRIAEVEQRLKAVQHKLKALAFEGLCAKCRHLPVSGFLQKTESLQGRLLQMLISCTVMLQDTELKQVLEAAQQRLQALDVEDLDAEREQLALTEHILEKLTSNGKQTQGAAGMTAESHAAAACATQQNPEAAQQRPVAMLGPP